MPRAVDVDGNTLLHAACARGALRAAKLVARWAVYSAHPPDRNFLNLQSGDGMTALDLARQGGFRKTEEWLVALGALGRGGTGPRQGGIGLATRGIGLGRCAGGSDTAGGAARGGRPTVFGVRRA